MTVQKEIKDRLYELRTFLDISKADMADRLGITESEYSRYEDGSDEAPIWLVYKFASIVDIEPGYVFTGKQPTKKNAAVVYDNKGQSVERYPGYSFTSLAPDFQNKQMKPMLVDISPTDKPELVCHAGQEFNYVLSGMLRVVVGDEEFYLHTGDSIYFDPSLPHAQMAMGDKPARFITVINE